MKPHDLYIALLHTEEDVPDVIQRRAFAALKGNSRQKPLLTGLMGIPNLLPEIDQAVKKMRGKDAAIAWNSRPGRTDAELAARLNKETRIGVLLEHVQATDEPVAGVLERLALLTDRNSTRAVLASHPAANFNTFVALATGMLTRWEFLGGAKEIIEFLDWHSCDDIEGVVRTVDDRRLNMAFVTWGAEDGEVAEDVVCTVAATWTDLLDSILNSLFAHSSNPADQLISDIEAQILQAIFDSGFVADSTGNVPTGSTLEQAPRLFQCLAESCATLDRAPDTPTVRQHRSALLDRTERLRDIVIRPGAPEVPWLTNLGLATMTSFLARPRKPADHYASTAELEHRLDCLYRMTRVRPELQFRSELVELFSHEQATGDMWRTYKAGERLDGWETSEILAKFLDAGREPLVIDILTEGHRFDSPEAAEQDVRREARELAWMVMHLWQERHDVARRVLEIFLASPSRVAQEAAQILMVRSETPFELCRPLRIDELRNAVKYNNPRANDMIAMLIEALGDNDDAWKTVETLMDSDDPLVTLDEVLNVTATMF